MNVRTSSQTYVRRKKESHLHAIDRLYEVVVAASLVYIELTMITSR